MITPRELGAGLAAAGVRHAFGVVGSGGSLDIVEGLAEGGAQFHVVGHEAAGVLMSAGAWGARGEPAVAVSIKGPGLTNALPGIAHCGFEQQPCITIAEAYGVNDDPARRHKRLDHGRLLGVVSKARFDLTDVDPDEILAVALAEAPGPVHVELAEQGGRSVSPRPPAPDGDVGPMLRAIGAARRPVVIGGALATRRSWAAELSRLSIPVFTTVSAKGVLDEAAVPSAGVFTGAGGERSPEHRILAEADLVVGLGLRGEEILSARCHVKTIVIDEVRGPGPRIGAHVRAADGSPAWAQVLDALAGRSWGVDAARDAVCDLVRLLDGPEWWPGSCLTALDDLPSPLTLVVDTGSFCTIAEHRFAAGSGRRFVGSSNGRYMGVAIPLAIGHALGSPSVPVACLVGDGGMWSYPGEWKVAIAASLPVCLILVRDGVYSSVAQARGARSAPVVIPDPSWSRVVEGMGCPSRVVEGSDALRDALSAWDRRTPMFIECAFASDWDDTLLRQLR